MKVSLAWLQTYFAEPLPETRQIVDALTFHSCEVEEVVETEKDVMLDVKVLPDRAPYALSHRGIALEVGAALARPLSRDPLREPVAPVPSTSEHITVEIESPELCPRYMATLITGVKVGPSPDWLEAALLSVGQRSINNIVDATNYVMFNMGQPLHAFDAQKLGRTETGARAISVRTTTPSEQMTALGGITYDLPQGTPVITDTTTGAILGIAGVKGGVAAEVTQDSTQVLIEAASFNPPQVRRSSQALKLWTDASQRFQNKLSTELAAYGMRDVCALITEIAGGTITAQIDRYEAPPPPQQQIHMSLSAINRVLGTDFTLQETVEALRRLYIDSTVATPSSGDPILSITAPIERNDLLNTQDIAEEVGRVLGYERGASRELPPPSTAPSSMRYRGIERIKDVLIERGFTEISTQSFAEKGDIILANPLQMDRPALRTTLKDSMKEALSRAVREAPRVLGPDPSLQLFEIGSVFTTEGEHLSLCFGYRAVSGKSLPVLADCLDRLESECVIPKVPVNDDVVELSLKDVDLETIGASYTPTPTRLSAYQPFSLYPFATRDIAVWVPGHIQSSEVSVLIAGAAGDLLARMDLFDRFEKEERTSYAFRLIFQSNERTLSDADLDPLMHEIAATLASQEGWEVR